MKRVAIRSVVVVAVAAIAVAGVAGVAYAQVATNASAQAAVTWKCVANTRLSRQFTEQTGVFNNFEKHFTARLDRVVHTLDSIQKRLNDIDERLEKIEAEVVPTAAPVALDS